MCINERDKSIRINTRTLQHFRTNIVLVQSINHTGEHQNKERKREIEREREKTIVYSDNNNSDNN